MKEWCLKNKEHLKEYGKKYYLKNKEDKLQSIVINSNQLLEEFEKDGRR